MGIIFVSCKRCVDHNYYLIKDVADKTLEMALVSHALICKTEQSMRVIFHQQTQRQFNMLTKSLHQPAFDMLNRWKKVPPGADGTEHTK